MIKEVTVRKTVLLVLSLILSFSVVSAPAAGSAGEPAEEDSTEVPSGEGYMGWSLKDEGPAISTFRAPTALRIPDPPATGVAGIDVSHHQLEMDWGGQWDLGKKFAYIKATEGYGWEDPRFSENYTRSRKNGLVRGAYHFARPDLGNSGKGEAKFFATHGGGWSADGTTLPGVLDIEDIPRKPRDCFKLSHEEVISWIADFVDEYKRQVGRPPVIYTNLDWWNRCTGDTDAFKDVAPLWFARWPYVAPGGTLPDAGRLPGDWDHYTFWQYWGQQLDQDHFNGTMRDLQHFATHPGAYSPGMASNITFTDVSPTHSFAEEIRWLSNSAITTGYDDDTFRPKNKITREAMAAFLYRLQGKPAYNAPTKSPFPDVPTSHDFYNEIAWLEEQGITTGYDDDTFRPKNKITREAMAAFIYRLQGKPAYNAPTKSPFPDVPTSHHFYNEITWLEEQGITTGYDDDTFRPKNKITREATAAFIHRYSG